MSSNLPPLFSLGNFQSCRSQGSLDMWRWRPRQTCTIPEWHPEVTNSSDRQAPCRPWLVTFHIPTAPSLRLTFLALNWTANKPIWKFAHKAHFFPTPEPDQRDRQIEKKKNWTGNAAFSLYLFFYYYVSLVYRSLCPGCSYFSFICEWRSL